MMTLVIVAGALAVVTVVAFVVVGMTKGFEQPPAPLLLKVAGLFGLLAAFFGFLHALT